MGYRITEREFDRIANIYGQLADECVNGLNRFYDEIVELSRKTTYKPLVDFSRSIYSFYMGDFRQHLMREFNDWNDSSYSLPALIRAIQGGSDAERNAARYMDRIEEHLRGLFRLYVDESALSFDTSEPEIENIDFETFQNAIEVYLRTAEDAKYTAVGSIQEMANDNNAVSCLEPYVETTGESVIESFESFIDSVEEGLGEFSGGVSKTLGERPNRVRTNEVKLPWGSGALYM